MLHRPHPRHRARSGAAPPGAPTGTGTRASPRPRCCSSCSSATSPCGGSTARPVTPPSAAPARRIVGLLLFPNVIVVHFSVDWWRSLHQTATITRLDPTIEGTMLFTLMLGIVVFGLRVRLAAGPPLPARRGSRSGSRHRGLDDALAERRAEAGIAGRGRPDARLHATPGTSPRAGASRSSSLAGYALRTVRRGKRARRAGAAGGAPVDLTPGGRHAAPAPRSPLAYVVLLVVLVALGRRGVQGALAPPRCTSTTPTRPSAQRDELGDKRFRLQGTVLGDTDRRDRRRRRASPSRSTASRVDVAPRRRPARAVRARHPGGARGPLGPDAATASPATASS